MEKQEAQKLGLNIKGLRESLGESQLQLALAVGLSSPGAISQIESGKRMPRRDTLTKIAKHYRISETELLHGNFATLSIEDMSLYEASRNVTAIEKMLPIICTPKALENENFRQAYELHMKIWNRYICGTQGDTFESNDVDECTDLYKKAHEEGVIEGAANHLWWIFMLGIVFSLAPLSLLENPDYLNRKDISIKEFLQAEYLRSFDEDTDAIREVDSKREQEKNLEAFLEEYEIPMILDIHSLKHSTDYSELGDYYFALRYKFNLCSTSSLPEMNGAFGDELILGYALLQNQYAKKLLGRSD